MLKREGFTLVELLVVIGILIILTGIATPALRFFQRESHLNNSAQEIINILRLAQNKTIASEGASNYGVHFETEKYVLFKGVNYDLLAADNEIRNLPKQIEIYEINLAGGGSEVVFDRIIGATSQFGEISLRLKTDSAKIRTVYIENSGQAGLTIPGTVSDENRIKDSRHVHFNYSRLISTSTESLTLTFAYDTLTVTEEIIIADHQRDGQIYWEGEVDVGGSIQKIKIHTHWLNNPDTQFSIHRDRRYNDKELEIGISGDTSGFLIHYSADGLTTNKTSIYASEPQWQ